MERVWIMLVITLNYDESLHIGDDIRVTVMKATGQAVKLATDAPDHVLINRMEQKSMISPEKKSPIIRWKRPLSVRYGIRSAGIPKTS